MMPFHPVKPIRGGRPLDRLYCQLAKDPEWVCQAKIDGQRTVWSGGTLWSRRELKIVRAPEVEAALGNAKEVFDGELVIKGGKQHYYLFDLPDHPGSLAERFARLREHVSAIGSPHVSLCPSGVEWEQVDQEQWEGVVFKRLNSKYPKGVTPNTTTPTWIKYRAEWL